MKFPYRQYHAPVSEWERWEWKRCQSGMALSSMLDSAIRVRNLCSPFPLLFHLTPFPLFPLAPYVVLLFAVADELPCDFIPFCPGSRASCA